jgi:hypothetical protein
MHQKGFPMRVDSSLSIGSGRHIIVSLAAFVAVLTALPALADSDDSLQVGTCARDITPITPSLAAQYQATFGVAGTVNHTDPIFIAGFGNDRQATGYNDRLWARGVVLQRKEERVAIISLDVVGYFKNEIDTIRALVSPSSEIDFVVVSSTHQHEGPDTLGIWGPDSTTTGIDYGYLDFVNAAVANCIDDAAASLEPARVYYATGNTAGLSLGLDPEDDGFGVADSRVLEGDAALAPATQGRIIDPRMTVMQLTQRDGNSLGVLATIVNFGSHPESIGASNTLITSDFPHYVRERIEAEYGGVAIWLAGDLGVLQGPLRIDVEDPDTGMPAPRRTIRFAEVHGIQLAERAIETINTVRFMGGSGAPNPSQGDPSPKIRYSTVDPVAVRMDNPFFRFFFAIGVLDARRTFFTDGVPDPSVGFPFPPPFDPIPQALGEDLHTEVSVLRIGAAQMAIVPTELDPQIGDMYRAALVEEGAQHTMIIGLGNDEIGYQVPFAKFDDSCQVCAPFILGGVPESCPLFPDIDCNTVFQNNVGEDVDPSVTNALHQAIDDL